ncbi:MAG: BatD family protein [Candidatus Omnitrophota bacterium]|nr:BatD family protein [Candidatus Omnitrophota bacterium]MBU1928504.1 BatD family protein [Candidatus Omnitrophota bacterium]MBU2034723.1 BatD family protein [Candidatus Omnitrophota bacterium]
MVKRIVFLFLVIVLFGVGSVFAETTIKAEVDKASLTTNDILTYKIIITSSEKYLSQQPEVSKFDGFNVISQAQSSTVSMVKSEVKTILVYAFILAPQSAGKFKIAPAVIKVKNKSISSQAFEIEVTQGSGEPKKEEEPSEPENEPERSSPESLPGSADQLQITL